MSVAKGIRKLLLTCTYRADATINSQATGAMSWAFISAIKANPKQSYVELLNSVRDILETKYTQKPQLSSSHPIGECAHTLEGERILTAELRYRPVVCDVTW